MQIIPPSPISPVDFLIPHLLSSATLQRTHPDLPSPPVAIFQRPQPNPGAHCLPALKI
ncbi:hypothetical protein L211DRAFT_842494 [Terfezia boudieri ATCC MYA-4762]|uniref:Uncharacterized protein n=1 Tax=Terfezia boudieri ATCC MYA-4762 TaxID=1051890 RepID=A0A3N4L9M2_9PEZI|nr:hypothetical protein L211DRAFT_842494 [Terfezia boudieri ATCC MYA-4762]